MHTLAQINGFPTGTKCPGFECTILRIGKFVSGTHQEHGPWSFQDLDVIDADGTKGILCLDKRQELDQSWKGAAVAFHAGEHQGKPTGIISEDHTPKASTYKPHPQTYRRIRITPSANMEDCGEGQPQQPAPQQRPQPRQQPQQGGQQAAGTYNSPTAAHDAANGRQPAQQRQQPAPAPQQRPQGQGQPQQPAQRAATGPATTSRQPNKQPPNNAVQIAKALAARIAVCKQLAYNASVANAWAAWETHGIKPSQEGVGAEASGIFIEMMRKMNHDVFDGLPYVLPPAKGRRLIDLYDTIDAERAAEIEHRKKAAADAPAGATPQQIDQYAAATRPQRQQPAPQPRQQPAQQAEPEDTGDGIDHQAEQPGGPQTWQEGLEDDDIPF